MSPSINVSLGRVVAATGDAFPSWLIPVAALVIALAVVLLVVAGRRSRVSSGLEDARNAARSAKDAAANAKASAASAQAAAGSAGESASSNGKHSAAPIAASADADSPDNA